MKTMADRRLAASYIRELCGDPSASIYIELWLAGKIRFGVSKQTFDACVKRMQAWRGPASSVALTDHAVQRWAITDFREIHIENSIKEPILRHFYITLIDNKEAA